MDEVSADSGWRLEKHNAPKGDRKPVIILGSQVSAAGAGTGTGTASGAGIRSRAPNLHLLIRTWLPMAETRDLKMCDPRQSPDLRFPFAVISYPLIATTCLGWG